MALFQGATQTTDREGEREREGSYWSAPVRRAFKPVTKTSYVNDWLRLLL